MNHLIERWHEKKGLVADLQADHRAGVEVDPGFVIGAYEELEAAGDAIVAALENNR